MTAASGFRLGPAELGVVGHGLSRPECIVAEADGTLWISDNRGGAVRLDPDGSQTLVGTIEGDPNGLAMARSGDLVVADISGGRLLGLSREGRSEVMLEAFEGRPLGAVNFVMVDPQDRMWVTVSTRAVPRRDALSEPRPDGYVLVIDEGGPRLAAEGFHFTNEIRLGRDGRYAYVAETALGRVTRLRVLPDGSLVEPEAFGPAPLFEGARVDGITFDAAGNLWVTEITRNAIAVITPEGRAEIVIADPSGVTLDTPTSITFGGADLRTAYIGSLRADHLVTFRVPVPGEALPHWRQRR